MIEYISIHALRVESDCRSLDPAVPSNIFQSTLSVWRATKLSPMSVMVYTISIHALRVESDETLPNVGYGLYNFNPRSPCGERHVNAIANTMQTQFQSTLSVWRATQISTRGYPRNKISIHALRVESDIFVLHGFGVKNDFNPRSPCGERPNIDVKKGERKIFQSTLSVWRATNMGKESWNEWKISIHALRVESDLQSVSKSSILHYFNPRSPCGERRPIARNAV